MSGEIIFIKDLDLEVKNGFNPDDELPWDVISLEPRKQLLLNEYSRLEKRLNQ